MQATPQPVQPRLITISAILFAPQEGESSTSWYTDVLLAMQLPDRPRVITVNCEPPSTPAQVDRLSPHFLATLQ